MHITPHILLLDDNKTDCYLTEEIIRQQIPSAAIMTFNCPQKAVEFIKSVHFDSSCDPKVFLPDLIFIDIGMPVLSGFDVLDELKELDIFKKKRIDVFILSSSTCEKDIKKALDKKLCMGYINKPLNKDKLANVIKWHIITYYTPKEKQGSRQKHVLI
jgi:CheY-like chemotaxis protein